MSQNRALKHFCCFLVIIVLFSFGFSFAEDFESFEVHDQRIRVYLTRLGLTDRLDVTIDTPYLLTDEYEKEFYFQKGTQLSFQLKNKDIYLYYEGLSHKLGKCITLERAAISEDEYAGFRVTNFQTQYSGDLILDIENHKLRPILVIHVEDYLLGVVPYEMGDDFPLEALKAQAVAARTYALRSQDTRFDFDVYDNTNDQVFKGYVPGNKTVEKAVEETKGVCGFYNGELAHCFYSASNGGQTELVQMVWPSKEDLGYYRFGDDPYDVENPASTVRSFEFKKEYKKAAAPLALRELIIADLGDTLASDGWDDSPEGIKVDKIKSVLVDSPNMRDSKLMTMLHIEAEISVRKVLRPEIRLVDSDTEEVSLFSVQDTENAANEAGFQPVVTIDPTLATDVKFGPFVPWNETITIDMPIFPDAEKAFQLSINRNYENEIWSVVESPKAFTIEVRRFGHGVGMSQRGAQVMAEKYQMTFQQILAFYYPGMDLKRYPEQERKVVLPEQALLATAGPAPSPTPRPTLMPATLIAEEGQWFAVVTQIADDSSLNLRSAPSLNSDILMRLFKGQRLLVVERCPEEDWVHVKTDVAEGYVMESYLSREE